jgi:hypothetical protein
MNSGKAYFYTLIGAMQTENHGLASDQQFFHASLPPV